MANQVSIQARVDYGSAKAAQYLGAPFNQFRPTNPLAPLTGSQIGTLQAAFDSDAKFGFVKPSSYAKPILYGLFDGTNVQVGDYFVHPTQGTFFAAGYEPIKPWLCVQCNRTLTFTRPTPTENGYSGRQNATDSTLAAGWPASVLQGTKGEANPTALPSDVRAPWVTILVPAIPGVTIDYSDMAIDDLGRRFVLSNVELTSLGYRISATYAGA